MQEKKDRYLVQIVLLIDKALTKLFTTLNFAQLLEYFIKTVDNYK